MFDAPPAETPTIVVTAALPDPAADRAYSVERISRQVLRDAPSSQLDLVLKQVPGLQLFRRSDARSGHPTSQGVTLRALGGNASSRALLVLDGVPQTDPFGGWINWPAYDPAAIGEIRVIRGGGSVSGGPGALAGIIEMSSRLDPALEASLQAGSRSAFEGNLHAAQPIGSSTLSVSGRAARGDGFVPITDETRGPIDRPADYREASVRALWVAPISSIIDVQAGALAFTDRRDRGLPFTDNRTNGADASLRLVGRGRWAWSATSYFQARELRSSFASVDEERTSAARVALQDKVPSHAYGGAFELRPQIGDAYELRIGGDARVTDGESQELFSYIAGEPTRRRRAGGRTLATGSFAELTGRVGRLTLSGGGRLDYWRITDGKLQERLIATGGVLRDEIYPDRHGWLPTARASAVLEAGSGFSFRSAAYLGWRLPTLNELFRPFRVGPDATAANALLKPERLAGFEGGADYRRKNINLSITAFVNRLNDAIANVTLGHGPGVFPGVGFVGPNGIYQQRQNLDAIRVRGIEASGEYRRGPWAFRVGTSLVDAKVEASGVAAALDGLRPAQTPRFYLTGAIGWEDRGRAVTLQIRHVGDQFDDDLNQVKLQPATTIDAFAAWPLIDKVQLIARGENLLDELVVAGIGGDGSIERATPRTLWIGLRFTR